VFKPAESEHLNLGIHAKISMSVRDRQGSLLAMFQNMQLY